MIEQHATDMLSTTLQPVFKKQALMHPSLSTKRSQSRYGSKDIDIHQDQQWKEEYYVDLLSWLLDNVSPQQLQDNLHLLIPPILIILDDYDVTYKERGVHMVHTMIQKLDPQCISKFGLDNVFLESLFKCLSYLSEERDIPLLKAAYPCILDLIATKRQEQVRSSLYERVFKDGIMTGFSYAGQKIKFLPILLTHIPQLYMAMGSIGVQYLKALIPELCAALSMTSSNNPKIRDINRLAALSLMAVIKTCWPRIPHYRGSIMQALAKTWTYYYHAKDQDLCQLLKQVYRVFEAACQGQDTADREALIQFNPTVFEALFCK
ncbi:hypothetical protein FB192DRAFT_1452449 [Mucor lusitanicus]|uniref:Uncharacterized protein n=1 Tax=Mucor circinelloides f. lusitanicus TaxID=29924 RepID=A0A8H4EWD7_MUCCL|nr:hypothetical protein FB192DRAFT_1452449 [Mucor lusitanicus]